MSRFHDTLLRLSMALAVSWVAGVACDPSGETSGGQTGICEEGTNIFCRCPTGEPGTKQCLDGNAFGACVVGVDTPCPVRHDVGSGTTGAGGGPSDVCEPGETVFCTCDAQTGIKTCIHDGGGFGECVCDAPSSGAGGTGGAATGNLPLYSPCSSPTDCDSGVCEMGYCTKSCTTIFDCTFDIAECVSISGNSFCRPLCGQQVDCAPYQLPSECGYTSAVDQFPVTVCADWFNTLQLPPVDFTCTADTNCHLGHTNMERVCDANDSTCEIGCHFDSDCPVGETCSGLSEPGVCGK